MKHLFLASLLIIALLLQLAPYTAYCEDSTKMKGPFGWPEKIDGWQVSGKPEEYDSKTTFKYMDGAAELFLAYNMKKLTVLRYEKPGQPSITAEIFQMGSAEDAYGLFTFESDDPGVGVGQGSEFGGGLLRFWKAHWFVSVYGEAPGADVEAATLAIGKYIDSSIKDTGSPPRILDFLPRGEPPFAKSQAWFVHSHILLNQRFFIAHKNVLNLANDVDAAVARYGTGKDRVHLLLVRYPSQARADAAFSGFTTAYMPDAGGKASMKTQNNKWTTARKQGNFIIIAFDAPDEAFVRNLIGSASAALKREGK